MKRACGMRIAVVTTVLGVLISLGTLAASRGVILEQWYLHRLRSGDFYAKSGAIHRLRELRSRRAVPPLFELAAASKTTPEREKISTQALAALREIRPGKGFLLARLEGGPAEEKLLARWLLDESAAVNSRPRTDPSGGSPPGKDRAPPGSRGGAP